MTELVTSVADKIDRAVQRVTPLAYRLRRRSRRWMRRALRKPRSVAEGPNLLPLLIQVLASFSKADGVLLEEEIDSSLGFLRYDYPEAVYSELRKLFRQALYEQQDLSEMAQKLAVQLSDRASSCRNQGWRDRRRMRPGSCFHCIGKGFMLAFARLFVKSGISYASARS